MVEFVQYGRKKMKVCVKWNWLIVYVCIIIGGGLWITHKLQVCSQAVGIGKAMLQIEDATFSMAEHCGTKNCSSKDMAEAVELVMASRATFVEKGKQCLGE